MILDNCNQIRDLAFGQSVVFGKLDMRRDPELGLSVARGHVDVDPRFLSREKEEAVGTLPKDRGAHGSMLLPASISRKPQRPTVFHSVAATGSIEGIYGVHHLHIWALGPSTPPSPVTSWSATSP